MSILRKYVEIRCSQTELVRYETLEGREHLVVPVVMLIGDTVVQGANAKTPEFIPLSTIESHFVAGWNSKPVVPYHPRGTNGKYVSANDPGICDSARLGPLFNTRIEDGKLKTEAWIDIERCHSLGGDAKDALTKLEKGESIDVSGGFIVEAIKQSGIAPNGAKYGAVWTDIDGDHLALLPNSEGACNQEMGCGAPRVHSVDNEYEYKPLGEEEMDKKPNTKSSDGGFLSRLFAKLRPSLVFDDGQSDQDLREMLGREIQKLDPTFDWVCRVFPESNAVIYSTYTMTLNWDSLMKWWRRTYTLSDDGKSVTVNNDVVEVRPKEVWETVDTGVVVEQEVIAAQEIRPNAQCSCQSPKESNILEKGEIQVNEDRKKKVNELIAAGKYTEEDRTCLEGITEKVFQSLTVAAPAPAPEVKVEVKTETPAPISPIITEEQALAALPGLRDMVSKYRAQEEAKKAYLVTRLVTAQKVHDETALKAMELSRLEEIALLVNLDVPKVDFSLHGAPKSTSATPVVARKLPDPWNLEKKQSQAN